MVKPDAVHECESDCMTNVMQLLVRDLIPIKPDEPFNLMFSMRSVSTSLRYDHPDCIDMGSNISRSPCRNFLVQDYGATITGLITWVVALIASSIDTTIGLIWRIDLVECWIRTLLGASVQGRYEMTTPQPIDGVPCLFFMVSLSNSLCWFPMGACRAACVSSRQGHIGSVVSA